MSDATLTTDSAARKDIPIVRGFLDYFPNAAAEVARLSQAGNEKHNPGEELHHARGKSSDHADCIVRHLLERGTVDTDGFLHEVKVAWRAMALLQESLEGRGAPLARGARLPQLTYLISEMDEKDLERARPGAIIPARTATSCEWQHCPECAGPSATDDCDGSEYGG